MLSLLAPRVTQLTQLAVFSRQSSISTIQALILLCVWPMPIDRLHKDITPVLAGATLHLAMTIGLHIYGNGQDFSRTNLNHDDGQKTLRAMMWVSCLMVCQRWAH